MEFLHFGMKVDDIQASAAMFEQLLDITWEPVKEHAVELEFADGRHRGRSLVTHGLTPGGVEIEMVETIEGRSPDIEALGDGQGVSHIAYRVADLGSAMARAERAGLRQVCFYASDYVDFVFYDGPGLGGILLQLVRFHGERR
jgi:hypothetical protein